jgi:hypothetical protein
MIDITGIDLVKFVQKVYELSVPQGLGFLHFTPTPLSEEEAKKIIDFDGRMKSKIKVSMDYVSGRACKMIVWEKDGKLGIADSWYDHTDKQLKQLLSEFNINVKTTGEHGCACNCADCQNKH